MLSGRREGLSALCIPRRGVSLLRDYAYPMFTECKVTHFS